MRKISFTKYGFLLLLLSTCFFSCSSTKKIKYFQDIPDSGQTKQIGKAEYVEPVIQVGNIMNVTLETVDATATSLVNAGNLVSGGSTSGNLPSSGSGLLASLSGGNGGAGGQQQPITGYLVDKDGYIEMPVIGKVKAAGLTTAQLKDTLTIYASKYYKDVVVIVRFANFKINVIGEVLKPGQYILPEEKTTILDAIALAGDLTIFGKRENVLLIRENPDGTKSTYRINLKKSDIISSPLYYVHQNDVIYVEPRKAKSDATDAAQQKYVAIAAGLLSVLIILGTRLK